MKQEAPDRLICGELAFEQACECVVSLQAVEKGTELDWGYGHATSRISLFP